MVMRWWWLGDGDKVMVIKWWWRWWLGDEDSDDERWCYHNGGKGGLCKLAGVVHCVAVQHNQLGKQLWWWLYIYFLIVFISNMISMIDMNDGHLIAKPASSAKAQIFSRSLPEPEERTISHLYSYKCNIIWQKIVTRPNNFRSKCRMRK